MKTLTTLAVALIALLIATDSALAYNYDLICDVSGSMRSERNRKKVMCASAFGLYVQLAPAGAVGRIGSFPRTQPGTPVAPVVKWSGLRETSKAELYEDVRLDCIRRGGGWSPLYRAIEEGCMDLDELDQPRHLVVCSDLGNTDPADPHLADAITQCINHDVTVDIIRIGLDEYPSAADDPGGNADVTHEVLLNQGWRVWVAPATPTDAHAVVRLIMRAIGVPSLSLVGMAAFAVLLVGIGTFFVLRRRTSTA